MIYLDNSATTKPCGKAIERINYALGECWGNPSSLHGLGISAEKEMEKSRYQAAKILSCKEEEIYFVSSGTEGNNTALLGAARSRKKRGNRIVTTAVEHPSVLETVKRLEEEGFEVVYLKPDKEGKINEEDIFSAVNEKTVLVSIMLVNNETGAIMPVSVAKKAVQRANAPALIHCDAVQGFGKMPIKVNSLGVDLLTISGHKIHGPKGVGVLYVKKGVTIKPLITGGGQERSMRSGTESLPLILGLSGAIEELGNIGETLQKVKELNLYAREILSKTNLVKINSPEDALPYILNISVEGYRSETMLHFLESREIFVSSSSACAKGRGSYVLREMGLNQKRVDSAIRLSFSRYNTKEEIDRLANAVKEAANTIRKAN